MTVIAAYAGPDWAALSADSATLRGSERYADVVKLQLLSAGPDIAVIATAGRAALRGLVADHLKLDSAPDHNDDQCNAWARAVARALVGLALDNTPPIISADRPHEMDGGALLAHRGRLWLLGPTGEAERIHGPAAIGAGEEYALGALHTIERQNREPMGPIVRHEEGLAATRTACHAAIRWSTVCDGDVYSVLSSRRDDHPELLRPPSCGDRSLTLHR